MRVSLVSCLALAAFLTAVPAIRALQKSKILADGNACVNTLKAVDSAKEQYSIKSSITNGLSTEADIRPFFGAKPIRCPTGASIDLQPIGLNPICSLHRSFQGGPDIRDYRYPHFPFRPDDWIFLLLYFVLVMSALLILRLRKGQRLWTPDIFVFSLLFGAITLASFLCRDTSRLRKVDREEWIKDAVSDMKRFRPSVLTRGTPIDAIIEDQAWVKLVDGWVYLVVHSWHSDTKIGNVILAIDSRGRLYRNGGHPCTGISLNLSQGGRKPTLDDFRKSKTDEGTRWEPLPESSVKKP